MFSEKWKEEGYLPMNYFYRRGDENPFYMMEVFHQCSCAWRNRGCMILPGHEAYQWYSRLLPGYKEQMLKEEDIEFDDPTESSNILGGNDDNDDNDTGGNKNFDTGDENDDMQDDANDGYHAANDVDADDEGAEEGANIGGNDDDDDNDTGGNKNFDTGDENDDVQDDANDGYHAANDVDADDEGAEEGAAEEYDESGDNKEEEEAAVNNDHDMRVLLRRGNIVQKANGPYAARGEKGCIVVYQADVAGGGCGYVTGLSRGSALGGKRKRVD
jgi:hypothetical protein